ncbi:unnamed protein product [Citrullus colocynthis]|uniref:Uncharacterized protein n=1 Tax=Citrullus colocynthis TaxID=252529 RepID=A0ABP0XT89_9ROSI
MEVVNFIKTITKIDRMKIFDTNPDILRAFAGFGESGHRSALGSRTYRAVSPSDAFSPEVRTLRKTEIGPVPIAREIEECRKKNRKEILERGIWDSCPNGSCDMEKSIIRE